MTKNVIAYIKSSLRRTWGRSKQKQSALKGAKVSYGKYKCAHCFGIFRRKDINVDHRVSIGKFVNFDIFIERLFCNSGMLDILCINCHKKKTKKDRKL